MRNKEIIHLLMEPAEVPPAIKCSSFSTTRSTFANFQKFLTTAHKGRSPQPVTRSHKNRNRIIQKKQKPNPAMMSSLLEAQKAFPGHFLAQRLNNRAAYCIEIGNHEEAILSLVQALRLSEKPHSESMSSMDMDVDEMTCECQRCSLEFCMSYSHKNSKPQSFDNNTSNKDGEKGGYVYRQPILIPTEIIQEGHFMGVVLPIILTFNLALSHHLDALEPNTVSRPQLRRVLRLYELAYRWLLEDDDIHSDSLQFTMVISNNLSEIHRLVSNHDKHQKCLEHLLSAMMYIVAMQQGSDAMNLDGFFRNTSELILHNRCAGAA